MQFNYFNESPQTRTVSKEWKNKGISANTAAEFFIFAREFSKVQA